MGTGALLFSFQMKIAKTLSGRPCGSADFVDKLETRLGRILQTPQMGRPRKAATPEALMEDLFM